MNLTEAMQLALSSMKTGKMRSMLTLLGIIIGIASVITILTLGHSLKTQTMGSLESMGVNNLNVQVKERKEAGESNDEYMFSSPPITDKSALITSRQLDQLSERYKGLIESISYSGEAGGMGDVTVEGEQYGTLASKGSKSSISPVNADYLSVNGYGISAGRGIVPQDVADARHVAVISPELVKELFDDDPSRALESEIRFTNEAGTASFLVVGVLNPPKGGLLIGDMSQAEMFVPYPIQELFDSAENKNMQTGAFSEVSVRMVPSADKDKLKQEFQAFFDANYQGSDSYQVKVSDNNKLLDQINGILGSISAVVAAIGGISLLVGGIGVMNVMLITVTERTREIGVRKALGARSRDIKVQFVIEAMIVCLIGGLIGVVLGSIFGMIGSAFLGTFVFPPFVAVAVSLLFSMGIGLFFGYYPAAKAAKMNPIEALRYE